jgi:hypothetical protein
MKNMKKIMFLVLMIAMSLKSYSQFYFFERDSKDSTRWRAGSVTQNKEGGLSYEYSPLYSQDSAVQVLVNMKFNKIKYREALDLELSRIDTTLKRQTGKVYDEYISGAIAAQLAGSWEYVNGTDTLNLNVDKNLKLSGGKIKGSIEIAKNGLLVNGVEKDPVLLPQKDKIFTNGKIKFYKI